MLTSSQALRRFVILVSMLTLCAACRAASYTVTPVAGDNGKISPTTAQTVQSGGFVTFTATPNAGFVVDQWLVNGTAADIPAGSITFSDGPVQGNETVKVTFKKAPQMRMWNERWDTALGGNGQVQTNYFNGFDAAGDTWVVNQVQPSGKPQFVEIYKLNQYGSVTYDLTVPSPNEIIPRGFAMDRMGDFFLQTDQYNSSFQETEVLQGWNPSWKPIFTKSTSFSTGQYATGLGLGTDFGGNVYSANTVQTNGTFAVNYTKYSGLGDFQFTKSLPFESNYARFDPTDGRCSMVGYELNKNGLAIGAAAAVFNSQSPTLGFYRTMAYTKNFDYYFGGGVFDQYGDYYLNQISANASGAATTLLDCYSPTMNLLYSNPISGYGWYTAASSPYKNFTWGSSDVYNSTGLFLMSNDYGTPLWNVSTQGYKVAAFNPDDLIGTLENDAMHSAIVASWNSQNGVQTVFGNFFGPKGSTSYIGETFNGGSCCCDCCGCPSFLAALSFLSGTDRAPTDVNVESGDAYIYAYTFGTTLNALSVAVPVVSGVTFPVTASLTSPLTEGEVRVDLSVTAGVFSNDLSTTSAIVAAPLQSTAAEVVPALTNAVEHLVVTAESQGVLRTVTVTVMPATIASIDLNTAVTAAANTTDAYTLDLNGKAGSGGIGVTITSSDTAVIPNASGTVAEGASSLAGSLKVNKVAAKETVTLTFKTSTGSSLAKVVTVSP